MKAKGGLGMLLCAVAAVGCAQQASSSGSSTLPEANGSTMVEEDFSVAYGERTVEGTFTCPSEGGPFPVLVLFAGSGPTDRNWENPILPGMRGTPRDLAPALAAEGIAVVRFDKIGTGESAMPDSLSWETYEAEQRAVVEYAVGRPEVDPGRVFLAGHSEGALHAMRLARNLEPEIVNSLAGVALLASPAGTMREVLVRQIDAQLRGVGVPDEPRRGMMRAFTEALDAVIQGQDPALDSLIPGLRALVQGLADPTGQPFVRELLAFDPVDAMQEQSGRILILQGDRDTQVLAADAERLAAAGQAQSEITLETHMIPNADHLFRVEERAMEDLTPAAVSAAYISERPLASGFVQALVDWVHGPGAE